MQYRDRHHHSQRQFKALLVKNLSDSWRDGCVPHVGEEWDTATGPVIRLGGTDLGDLKGRGDMSTSRDALIVDFLRD